MYKLNTTNAQAPYPEPLLRSNSMAFHRLVAACVVCAATIFLGRVTVADERQGKAVE
jgi:hypothetical protein